MRGLKRVKRKLDDVCRAVAYLFTALGGAWLFLYQPPIIRERGVLAYVLVLLWAVLITTAFPAALATYRGRFGTEYWCLPFFTGGLVLALIHGWTNLTEDSFPRVAFVTALALLFAARFFVLHQVVRIAQGE